MFITIAIAIQALFWVLLGALLVVAFDCRKVSPIVKSDDEDADQKILDLATEYHNDVAF